MVLGVLSPIDQAYPFAYSCSSTLHKSCTKMACLIKGVGSCQNAKKQIIVEAH